MFLMALLLQPLRRYCIFLVVFGWGSRNESGQKYSEPLLMEPGLLPSWDGGEQMSYLDIFCESNKSSGFHVNGPA